MKTLPVIRSVIVFIPMIFLLSFSSCIWPFKSKTNNQNPGDTGGNDVKQNVDELIKQKLKGYQVVAKYDIPNAGYYKVEMTPEVAPFMIGQIVKKNKGISQTTLPTLLDAFATDISTEMKFSQPEVNMYVDNEVSGSISTVVGNANMSASDKLNIIYQKVYTGVHKNPWNTTAFEAAITKYGLEEKDSLFVVTAAEVKLFTFSIYTTFTGTVSASPVPIVKIGANIYQGSGLSQNVYELYLQLAPVSFPKKTGADLSGTLSKAMVTVGKPVITKTHLVLKVNKIEDFKGRASN